MKIVCWAVGAALAAVHASLCSHSSVHAAAPGIVRRSVNHIVDRTVRIRIQLCRWFWLRRRCVCRCVHMCVQLGCGLWSAARRDPGAGSCPVRCGCTVPSVRCSDAFPRAPILVRRYTQHGTVHDTTIDMFDVGPFFHYLFAVARFRKPNRRSTIRSAAVYPTNPRSGPVFCVLTFI